MRFKIQIDGDDHEIEADADGRVSLAGETFETKVGKPAEERRTVQLSGNTYDVRVVEGSVETGAFVLEVAGERVPVTVTEVSKAAYSTTYDAGAAAAAVGVAGGMSEAQRGSTELPEEVKEGVWAPVPGKVVDVLVQVGHVVNEGDPVLILEAMKMENELRAPRGGRVSAVLVAKGDQAEKGQLLVALE